MRKLVPALTLLAACVFASACSPQVQADPVEPSHTAPAPMAPDFQGIGQWFNSAPLSLPRLRGKVVLVEFWTYSCINCIHVLPHVKQWHADYHDQGLVVVGVHTPEYAYEKQAHNLQAAVQRFGITYPVAQDNDYRTWNAYGNQYWPALYLIDADGRIVYQHFGEGGYAQTEAKIRQLLAARRDDAPASRAR
ncbi:thioredoxin [Stenotrophomonas panacihumi]|uniref:Thioredoxin n=1 Tax=Stenotrophomonas panacihumi TaxID=676599 RepID=A0A0R0AG18_9GAMM|nr:thioredoxin family protein [Stenotrophomonas panacihumi]KRG43161.1 thioredoxin [Stenotrophomonas panacihumi]PTN53911.1 thioredoxin [Stenotrophomonas panacihumi]